MWWPTATTTRTSCTGSATTRTICNWLRVVGMVRDADWDTENMPKVVYVQRRFLKIPIRASGWDCWINASRSNGSTAICRGGVAD